MAISGANSVNTPRPDAHVRNATNTGQAQRMGAAARGDETGKKQADANAGAGGPQESAETQYIFQSDQNGIKHYKAADGSSEVYEGKNGVSVELKPGLYLIGMPDQDSLLHMRDDGTAFGQSLSTGKKFEVQRDDTNHTLTYQDATGKTHSVEPRTLRVGVTDPQSGVTTYTYADGTQRQAAAAQPPPQQTPQPGAAQPQPNGGAPNGIINPNLGAGQVQGGGVYTQGLYAQPSQQPNVMTGSGLMRTMTPDGLMVISLPNGVAISHGPAGAMALDSRSPQPIPVQVSPHRRSDGTQEWMYQFNDAQGNLYTMFSDSMDFTVESPDRRVAQMVLPTGNVVTGVKGDKGLYTHETMPNGQSVQNGPPGQPGPQWAGDRVIMPQGEYQTMAGIPFPTSGYQAPAIQEQAARGTQNPANPNAGNQPHVQSNVDPSQFQGGPQGPQAGGGGGAIPGMPDNPIPTPGQPQNQGQWNPNGSVTPGHGPPVPVKPSLWQRFKNFLSGNRNQQPQQNQWHPQPQGPWQAPPYQQYGQGPWNQGPQYGPGGYPSQVMPPVQSNNWMTGMLAMSTIGTVLSGGMMMLNMAMCSPWNMSFYSPFGGMGFF